MLDALVRGARDALGADLCGAYLQGSFALGAGDEHSDVDFLVVTRREVDAEQEAALRELHARLPDSPVPWAQHLEGSYAPAAQLRQAGRPAGGWLYVDNGSRAMERSAHDDTVATRWVLREHGVVLTGPDPATLVDAVPPPLLRQEAVATIRRWEAYLEEDPGALGDAWSQPHAVLALCRSLFTLATARVTSKTEAGSWAQGTLDPAWAGLVRQAVEDRPDPWGRVHRRADPVAAERTREFLAYVVGYAGNPPVPW